MAGRSPRRATALSPSSVVTRGAFRFADDAVPSQSNIRIRKTNVREIRHILPAGVREVAPVICPAHSQQMPHHGPARHTVEISEVPAVLKDRRRQEQRRVCHAAGDDHIGAGGERLAAARHAEIGVRRHQPLVADSGSPVSSTRSPGLSCFNTSSPVTAATLISSLRRLAIATIRSAARPIRRTHVGDDTHPLFLDDRQQQLHAPCEQHVVAFGGSLSLRQLCERDGALARHSSPRYCSSPRSASITPARGGRRQSRRPSRCGSHRVFRAASLSCREDCAPREKTCLSTTPACP